MTNADKIRAMCIEELAIFLVRTELEEIPSEFYDDETQVVFRSPSGKKFYWKEQAIKDSLGWLKQEVEDE